MSRSSINWFTKLCQNEAEWGFRERGLLSHFGWRDFAVVEILQNRGNEEWPSGFGMNVGPNPPPEWRGSPVPCKTIALYTDNESGVSRYDEVGKTHKVHPSNLYRTLGDLIEKQAKSLYPDLTLELMQKPHIASFIKDFPEMEGDLKPGDAVDYQVFDVQGYEVQVFSDTQAAERNPAILQTRGTDGIFYWNIPSLKTRSVDKKPGIDLTPWGTGKYPTMQRALETAEEFIDFMFYGE